MDLSTTFPLTVLGADQAFRRLPSVGRSFWTVLTQAVLGGVGLHLVFVVLFAALQRPSLAWAHAVGMLTFGLAWQLLLRRHNRPALLLVWLQILLHAALALRLLGWDSGYHYHLLTFVPAIFVMSPRHRLPKIVFLVGLCALYMVLDARVREFGPAQPLPAEALGVVRYMNIAVTFLVLGYLTFFYFQNVAEAEQRLRRMAATDPLTGLANRRRAQEISHYEIVKRKRVPEPLAFVLADIDHFKAFNDRYGHEVGDRVLESVAQILRESVREQDSVARWGGEEFLLVLPRADLGAAQRVAERVRRAVADARLHAGDEMLTLSITLGVSLHRDGEGLEDSVARADAALYAGKREGRNRVMLA